MDRSIRRRLTHLACLAAVATGVSAAPQAHAGATPCGLPSFGAVYRVGAAHLKLNLTAHYRDSAGDSQDATITMDGTAHPAGLASPTNYALFNHGLCDQPLFQSLSTLHPLTFSANVSWYDSGVESGSPPSNGGCSGSYQAAVTLESAWHLDLRTASNNFVKPRSPELDIGSYVNPARIGTCNQNDIEILRDAISAGLDTAHYAHFKLAVSTLQRAGREFAIRLNVTHSGSVPIQGVQYFGAPGAAATVDLQWQGSVPFRHEYSCPHGCLPPGSPYGG